MYVDWFKSDLPARKPLNWTFFRQRSPGKQPMKKTGDRISPRIHCWDSSQKDGASRTVWSVQKLTRYVESFCVWFFIGQKTAPKWFHSDRKAARLTTGKATVCRMRIGKRIHHLGYLESLESAYGRSVYFIWARSLHKSHIHIGVIKLMNSRAESDIMVWSSADAHQVRFDLE